jgi:hypothetical protein
VSGLLVHGVVPASARLRGDLGVDFVAEGQVAALATLEEAADGSRRRALLRHSDVLQEAVTATTVLPLRFGTVFVGVEELVGEFLRPRHEELAELLSALDGKVEMSFRATLREEAVLRTIVAADGEVAALREATRGLPETAAYADCLRLGELVAGATARMRGAYELRFLDTVAPHVAATLLPDDAPSTTTIRAALLVARDAVAGLESSLEGFARETAEHLESRLLGPLPPYSFVDRVSAAA